MKPPLFWVDLEMTGLDEKTDHILEIAVIVTDFEFKSIEEYHRIVYQPPAVLEGMNDWCKKHHGQSGLTALVPNGVSVAAVDAEVASLIERHYKSDDHVVLCGNSIGNDRRFIEAYLPLVAKRLHYRMIDVSSFKEIFRDKYGLAFKKGQTHRAIEDIRESIKELAYYLSFVTVAKTV